MRAVVVKWKRAVFANRIHIHPSPVRPTALRVFLRMTGSVIEFNIHAFVRRSTVDA